MYAVNEIFVPSIKVLTQIESQLFLFEQDLDRALADGKIRPKLVDLQSMESKLNYLAKLQSGTGDEYDYSQAVQSLQKSFSQFSYSVDRALSVKNIAELPTTLPEDRAMLRQDLRSMIRIFEHEARMQALAMQNRVSRSGIAVTLLLAVLLIVSVSLIYLTSSALEPLRPLTQLIQRISERGFQGEEADVLQLAQGRHDEVGTLAREFAMMVSSLKDRSLKIEEQKHNLERAHLEMARQNMALRQTQAKLVHQEKLALVGKLSAQVAHEIRNPLNALGLHLDFLETQSEWRTEAARQSMHSLRKELDRLASLTDGYLNLARTPKLEPMAVSLNELALETKELYAPWLGGQKIDLDINLGSKSLARADRQQIAQVFGNLLKNAGESFGERHATRKIRLETRDRLEEGWVEFICEDNGRGIPERVAKEIFSPFFTTKASGTGIGLAYSKQLVEASGGSISFASREGQGTIFSVRLPMSGVVNA